MGVQQESTDNVPDNKKDILLKAFDVAQSWSNQIVTLSTGVIVFTAVFRRDIIGGRELRESSWLWYAWFALGLAAVLGVFFSASLTAILNRGRMEELDLYKMAPRIMGTLELVAFVVGIALFLRFVWANFP